MVVQRVRVAVRIFSTKGRSSQRVNVRLSVGTDYAGSTCRGRRFGTYRALLT